ncbi:MAG TPA: hypothetical protein VIX89_03635 [Bryobacteraceae bacterium]
MSNPINDPAMQLDQSEELFVVELDDRLEFGVAVLNDIQPLDAGCAPNSNGCANTGACNIGNCNGGNGSNCG